MTDETYLRVRDLMARYDLHSPATVYNWIRTRGFPRSSRPGRWRLSQIEAWEKSRESNG